MNVSPRTLIVDDHRSFADSLACALRQRGWRDVEATHSAEAAKRMHASHPYDVVVSDVSLPGEDAFVCAESLKRVHPATKIVLLSAFHTDAMVDRAIQAKVRGYVLKTEPIEFVFESLSRVARGESAFSPDVARRIQRGEGLHASESPKSPLTKRQTEVLTLLAQGLTVKETAKKLFLSPKSVESHKTRIMATLNLHNRVALTLYAVSRGLATIEVASAR